MSQTANNGENPTRDDHSLESHGILHLPIGRDTVFNGFMHVYKGKEVLTRPASIHLWQPEDSSLSDEQVTKLAEQFSIPHALYGVNDEGRFGSEILKELFTLTHITVDRVLADDARRTFDTHKAAQARITSLRAQGKPVPGPLKNTPIPNQFEISLIAYADVINQEIDTASKTIESVFVGESPGAKRRAMIESVDEWWDDVTPTYGVSNVVRLLQLVANKGRNDGMIEADRLLAAFLHNRMLSDQL